MTAESSRRGRRLEHAGARWNNRRLARSVAGCMLPGTFHGHTRRNEPLCRRRAGCGLMLVFFDQIFDPAGVGLGVAVAFQRIGSAAGLN